MGGRSGPSATRRLLVEVLCVHVANAVLGVLLGSLSLENGAVPSLRRLETASAVIGAPYISLHLCRKVSNLWIYQLESSQSQ